MTEYRLHMRAAYATALYRTKVHKRDAIAVTLVIGLLANVFTSIYVSRAIFDYHLAHMERQAELSI